MKEGAHTPGCSQCPKQTGRDLGAHGNQRGRGRGTEYDRKNKSQIAHFCLKNKNMQSRKTDSNFSLDRQFVYVLLASKVR